MRFLHRVKNRLPDEFEFSKDGYNLFVRMENDKDMTWLLGSNDYSNDYGYTHGVELDLQFQTQNLRHKIVYSGHMIYFFDIEIEYHFVEKLNKQLRRKLR